MWKECDAPLLGSCGNVQKRSQSVLNSPIAKCKSFLIMKSSLVPSPFHRCVTFQKLSALACAESSSFSPEPEQDFGAEDELTRTSSQDLGLQPLPDKPDFNFFSKHFEQVAPNPFLDNAVEPPSIKIGAKKTLVLDLDETLISAAGSDKQAENNVDVSAISFRDESGNIVEFEFYVRPYTHTFLHDLSALYEIIV